MNQTGIKPQVIQEICQIAEKYGVQKVILFGSRARGDFHRASDIDLAVSGGNVDKFALDVNEETSTLLQYDIIDLNQKIQEKLLQSINQEGIVLYEKFDNYVSNLTVLANAEKEDLKNEFIISGIIDKFFLQFELGWKVLKELLRYEGMSVANTGSPREIIKAAYEICDYMDEDIWLSMLRARNDMTHIYDGDAAKKMVEKILKDYIPEFQKLQQNILNRYENILDKI